MVVCKYIRRRLIPHLYLPIENESVAKGWLTLLNINPWGSWAGFAWEGAATQGWHWRLDTLLFLYRLKWVPRRARLAVSPLDSDIFTIQTQELSSSLPKMSNYSFRHPQLLSAYCVLCLRSETWSRLQPHHCQVSQDSSSWWSEFAGWHRISKVYPARRPRGWQISPLYSKPVIYSWELWQCEEPGGEQLHWLWWVICLSVDF